MNDWKHAYFALMAWVFGVLAANQLLIGVVTHGQGLVLLIIEVVVTLAGSWILWRTAA